MNPDFDLESVLERPGALERLTELEWDEEDEALAADLIADDASSCVRITCSNDGGITGNSCEILEWLGLYFWKTHWSDGLEGPYDSPEELQSMQYFHFNAELMAKSTGEDSVRFLIYRVASGLPKPLELVSELILPGMKMVVNNTTYQMTSNGLEECSE